MCPVESMNTILPTREHRQWGRRDSGGEGSRQQAMGATVQQLPTVADCVHPWRKHRLWLLHWWAVSLPGQGWGQALWDLSLRSPLLLRLIPLGVSPLRGRYYHLKILSKNLVWPFVVALTMIFILGLIFFSCKFSQFSFSLHSYHLFCFFFSSQKAASRSDGRKVTDSLRKGGLLSTELYSGFKAACV